MIKKTIIAFALMGTFMTPVLAQAQPPYPPPPGFGPPPPGFFPRVTPGPVPPGSNGGVFIGVWPFFGLGITPPAPSGPSLGNSGVCYKQVLNPSGFYQWVNVCAH